MERQAKLRRLEDFRRSKPHCSASALSEILKDIRQHGVPDLTDRASMRKGRDQVAEYATQYGPIVKSMSLIDKDGNLVDFPFACPLASLTYALAESPAFRALFKHRLSLQESSFEAPWTIALYCDEVTPGTP